MVRVYEYVLPFGIGLQIRIVRQAGTGASPGGREAGMCPFQTFNPININIHICPTLIRTAPSKFHIIIKYT